MALHVFQKTQSPVAWMLRSEHACSGCREILMRVETGALRRTSSSTCASQILAVD